MWDAYDEACAYPMPEGSRFLNHWLYRVLRKGESPLEMRRPEDHRLELLDSEELRALLLEAVAFGNDPDRPGVFLHATTKLSTARRIRQERSSLYSNWVVRWPAVQEGVRVIDLKNSREGRGLLEDTAGDSHFLHECVKQARAFATKDSEVVLVNSPNKDTVERWGEYSRRWRPTRDLALELAREACAKAPGSSSSATSLEGAAAPHKAKPQRQQPQLQEAPQSWLI